MKKLGKLLSHRAPWMGGLILLQLISSVILIQQFSQYYIYVSWLCITITVLAVVWIIGNRSNPGYKLGWVILILVFPLFGGIAYMLFGGNRLSRYNQKRLKVMQYKIKQNLGEECRSDVFQEVAGPEAGHIARYLERVACCPVYGNTATKYYPLGDDCYDDILQALEQAERYIFVEYFIIEEGMFWNSVLDVLERKAAQGVEVRVIYDDIGSLFTLPADYNRRLEQRGIHCRVFNRLVPVVSLRQNNRDHRKYLIVDGKIAFTGGINMADEYINVKKRFGHWKDSAIRLQGDAVWSMTVSFLSMWDFTEGSVEEYSPFRADPAPLTPAGGYVQPYSDCPWDEEPVGQTVYLKLINRAREYVYITTPYLVIDYSTTLALASAAKSGVDVRIITPHIPDKKTVFQVTRSCYPELVEAGVKIFEYEPGFIHGKNFVVDDRYATVGSINMDYRSMFLHFENSVLLYDTPTIQDIKRDFLETQAVSIPITPAVCKAVPWYKQVLRNVLRVFAPLL